MAPSAFGRCRSHIPDSTRVCPRVLGATSLPTHRQQVWATPVLSWGRQRLHSTPPAGTEGSTSTFQTATHPLTALARGRIMAISHNWPLPWSRFVANLLLLLLLRCDSPSPPCYCCSQPITKSIIVTRVCRRCDVCFFFFICAVPPTA